MHVALDDHVFNDARRRRVNRLLCRQGLRVARQEDTLTLAARLRLDDERLVALFRDLLQKLLKVFRQIIRRWEKVVVVREDLLQSH